MQPILMYADKANILIPILFVIVVAIYAKKILNLFDQVKLRKVNYLSSLYENKHLHENTKEMIKEEINNAAFKSAIGIRVETTLRKQLTELHNKDKNTFTWKRLRMSMNYLDHETDEIKVKIGWFEKINLYSSLIGIACVIIMYILNLIMLVIKHDLESFINFFFYTGGLGLLFVFFGYSLAEYYHAYKLNKALEKFESKDVALSTCKDKKE
ncbi:hypothetical protein [Sulfurospirillum arcachonense]|uniref:hypothetical protein n=1 Tax=Sulfurospirillum arcachonense TaxID=57666 RepID=UPI00046895C0|nr:hypothetical protein [Sulfurospirillum arcachonense]